MVWAEKQLKKQKLNVGDLQRDRFAETESIVQMPNPALLTFKDLSAYIPPKSEL